MQKCIALILITVLLLTACSGLVKEESIPTTLDTTADAAFLVGFGEADITPDFQVDLAGYGNNATRLSTGFKTYIYAHVLALRDAEGSTALLISMDAGSCSATFTQKLIQWAEAEHGIPRENFMLSASHQHSCPSLSTNYAKFAEKRIKAAIDDAIADLTPAEMYINSVETTALSFVRNYVMNNGTIYGDGYGSSASGIKCHESESDKEMQLVKFTREGKQPVVVVNFQAHPHMGTSSNDTNISADWPGIMRQTVQEELGYHVMYFSGASGNLNSTSRITEENVSTDFRHHGQRAANYVIDAEDSYIKVETGKVIGKQQTIAYATNHENDHLIEQANYVHGIRQTQGLDAGVSAAGMHEEIHSVYHASAIVGQYAAGATRELTIGAISIGDVAFTAHSYEMFDTNGMELKQGTVGNEAFPAEDQLENPYKMTVITTMTNTSNGYIPSRIGCTNGGYSTDITYFAYGTAEILVGDYLALLQELHGQ